MADKKPCKQQENPCAHCIWRMCGNERVICSLPRCVNQWQCERPKHKIGPGGCWTYQRPLRKAPYDQPPGMPTEPCAGSTGPG